MDLSTYQPPFKRKPVSAATTGKKIYETDFIYSDLSDLVNDQYRAWYCSKIHAIGRDRIMILAAQARADGKDKKKLFSHLLRKEAK